MISVILRRCAVVLVMSYCLLWLVSTKGSRAASDKTTEVPPAAEVILSPKSVVAPEGTLFYFSCYFIGKGANLYSILLNNSLISNVNVAVGSEEPGSLPVTAERQYNNTVVVCEAAVRDESGRLSTMLSESSSIVIRAIQISDVNFGEDIATVEWNTNFTTNNSYCLEVRRTEPVEEVVESVCGLTGPDYSFQFPEHSLCDRFSFTVTPTSGGMNGTTSPPETGYFTQATGENKDIQIKVIQPSNSEDKMVNLIATLPNCTEFVFYQINCECSQCLDPMGGDINGYSDNELLLQFTVSSDERIAFNFTLSDAAGRTLIFHNLSISSHDLQEVDFSQCSSGECVMVDPVFVEGSPAPGALLVLVPLMDNTLHHNNMVMLPVRSTGVTNTSLPPGDYRVVAFDLESNGLPRIPVSTAALSTRINITSPSKEHDVFVPSRNSTGVTTTRSQAGVTVSCSDPSLNCLVILHSPSVLDQLTVGIIRDRQDRMLSLQSPAESDVIVAVFSWRETESMFSGALTHVSRLEPPATTTSPTTDQTIISVDPSVGDPSGLQPHTQIIISIVVPVSVLSVLIIAIVIVLLLLVRKNRYSDKIQESPELKGGHDDDKTNGTNPPTFHNYFPPEGTEECQDLDDGPYAEIPFSLNGKSHDANNNNSSTQRTEPVNSVYDSLTPDFSSHCYSVVNKKKSKVGDHDPTQAGFYDVAKLENMEPQYETVSPPTSPTYSETPPLLPPRGAEACEPPPLPPPYNPSTDVERSLVAYSVTAPVYDTVEDDPGLTDTGGGVTSLPLSVLTTKVTD